MRFAYSMSSSAVRSGAVMESAPEMFSKFDDIYLYSTLKYQNIYTTLKFMTIIAIGKWKMNILLCLIEHDR